jgi:hypothetical protein
MLQKLREEIARNVALIASAFRKLRTPLEHWKFVVKMEEKKNEMRAHS